MKFEDWFDEDEFDLFNDPIEAVEAAWNIQQVAIDGKQAEIDRLQSIVEIAADVASKTTDTMIRQDERIDHLTAELSRYRESGEVLELAAQICESETFIDLAADLRELAKPQE